MKTFKREVYLLRKHIVKAFLLYIPHKETGNFKAMGYKWRTLTPNGVGALIRSRVYQYLLCGKS